MTLSENGQEVGIIRLADIEQEMRSAYLDYAMSVIVARALPDARDGLKPVQRRILYAMHDMGLRANTAYKKSARIVGEVLGKYHPHGDAAVYETMARMAQDFSMRYPLVDGQGNFGSIDGDSPAAMRYTEARLAATAETMLADIEKETVDWGPNFDGSLNEPLVLPGLLPNLLVNGASGIAVGMATNIPPHNLGEIADAVVYLIDHWDEADSITPEDLMRLVPGPDFPTGGIILGSEGIAKAYATGQGRLVVRAATAIEEMKGGRQRIIVTEIPYQLNKSALLERIAELVRNGRLDQIADLRDESDRQGMHIVIELKRGAPARKVLNQLFKYTPLQTTYSINLLALVENEPRHLSLKRALQIYIEHRRDVLTRRTRYELAQAQARAHILEGLRIALANLDAVIALIRAAASVEEARAGLMSRFRLSEVQAQAILDMPLRRLAALERQKIEDEYREVQATIARLEDLLANPHKILALVKSDLLALKEKFGDARRTHIVAEEKEDFTDEDLIPQEEVLITITQQGYVKRTPARAFRAQARGGRGVTGMATKDEDAVFYVLSARTLDYVLFFTHRGRVFSQRVHQLPDAGRDARGVPLVNLIGLEPGERVTAAVAVSDFAQAEYLTMATVNGKVKRTALAEFEAVRPSGIIALTLDEGDELGWVRLTHGEQELIMVTERGQALRFSEAEVRPMGRSAAGVWGIRLAEGDRVASMDVVEPEGELLLVTAKGFSKRTPLSEYPRRGRYSGGVQTLTRNLERTGPIVAARVVRPQDELAIVTAQGMALRTKVADVPSQGRAAGGARLMILDGGDTVASIARLSANESAEPAPA
jgi:DNA gyrase subunit A